jgi:hypothetical protein
MVIDSTSSTTSRASVATDRPERYGKQLVSHLSRRATGTWDEATQAGVIDFSSSRAELSCAPASLEIVLMAAPADLDRMESVVGSHLVRFGTRDELVVTWARADGTAGTTQRKDLEDGKDLEENKDRTTGE